MNALILKGPKGAVYNLFLKSQHTVARDNADLVLTDDTSLSRHHATINLAIKDKHIKIFVKDHNSKYGTYINDNIDKRKRITPETDVEIKVGDRIKFGLQFNIWIVEELPLCVCNNGLSFQDKNQLEKIIYPLNGSIVSEWSDRCTHLITDQTTVTKRVVCALACVKPIVTLEYWKKLNSIVNSKTAVPFLDCKAFFPPFSMKIRNINPTLFEPKLSRQNLFSNMTFYVFSDKQYKDVFPLVSSSGGELFDVSKNDVVSLQHKTSKFVVLIPPKTCRNDDRFKTFIDTIQSSQLRLIPEIEIMLAVIFCSVDSFCNTFWDPEDDFNDDEKDIALLKNNIQLDSDEDITELESQNSNIELAFPSTKRLFEESSDEEDNQRLFKIPATGRPKRKDTDDDVFVHNTFCEAFEKKSCGDTFCSNVTTDSNAGSSSSSSNSKLVKTVNKANIGGMDNNNSNNFERNLRSKRNSLFDFPSTRSSSSSTACDGFNDNKRKKSVNDRKTVLQSQNDEPNDEAKGNNETIPTVKKLRFSNGNGNNSTKTDSQLMTKVKQSFMSNYVSKLSKSISAQLSVSENDQQKRTEILELSSDVIGQSTKVKNESVVINYENNKKEPSQFIVTSTDHLPIPEQDIDQLDPEIREVINKVKIVIKPLVVREKTPVNHEKENALKLKLLKKQQLPIIIRCAKMENDKFDDEGSEKELF